MSLRDVICLRRDMLLRNAICRFRGVICSPGERGGGGQSPSHLLRRSSPRGASLWARKGEKWRKIYSLFGMMRSFSTRVFDKMVVKVITEETAMKSNATKSRTVRTEVREVEGIKYRYELTRRENRSVAGFGIPLYSFAVVMEFTDTGKRSEGNTTDLFADSGKAMRFFEKLVDNLATPIDLAYIVEDELG